MRSLARQHAAFIVVAVAILAARLAFAFVFPILQISDYAGYYAGALRLAGLQEGPPGSWDPIGPKLLYALPLRMFGSDVRVLGVTNAFLFFGGVIFLYRATRLAFDASTATLTGLISLLSLSDLYFNNLACTEVLSAFFLNVLFFQLVRPFAKLSLLALGAVLGLAVYTRSNMIVMGSAVLVASWFQSRDGALALRRTVLVHVSALLVVLPLCWRNYSQFGHFTPVTSNSGMQVWYGNNPATQPGSHVYAPLPEELPVGSPARLELANAYRSFLPTAGAVSTEPPGDPYVLSSIGVRYALAWIRANPAEYAKRVVARVRQMYEDCSYGVAPYLFYDPTSPGQPAWWSPARELLLGRSVPVRLPDGPPNPRSAANRLVGAWYRVLAAGAALGFLGTLGHAVRTRSGWTRLLPGMMIVIYSVPFFLTIALNRYHVPAMGLLWAYLAHGVLLIFRSLPPSLLRSGPGAPLRPIGRAPDVL